MKRILKILLIAIILILVLTLAIAGYLLFSIRDKSDPTPETVRKEDPALMQVVGRETTEALSGASEQDDLTLSLDETDLTELLYAALVKDTGVTRFTGAYAHFDTDGALRLELPMKVYGVRTCLQGTLVLNDDGEALTASLTDASAGKLSCTEGVLQSLLSSRFTERKLASKLREAGLEAEISMDTMTVRITHSAIVSFLSEILKDDPNSALYTVLADLCMRNPALLELHVGGNDSLGFTLHCANITYDAERDGDIRFPFDLESVRGRVNEGLADKVRYDNVSVVYNYYISGYDALSQEDQAIITSLGLSSAERGIRPAGTTDVVAAILLQKPTTALPELILQQRFTVSLNEETLDAIFANFGFIGTCFAFTDGSETAYCVLESLTAQVNTDMVTLRMIINLNGKRLCVSLTAGCEPANAEQITARATSLFFGSVRLDDRYISGILSYLQAVLKDEPFITCMPEEKTMQIDLGVVLDKAGGFEPVRSRAQSVTMSLTEGKLLLSYCFSFLP